MMPLPGHIASWENLMMATVMMRRMRADVRHAAGGTSFRWLVVVLLGMLRMLWRMRLCTWSTAAGIEVFAVWIVTAFGLCWFAATWVFTRTVSLRW